MRKVGVESVGVGALKLTGFLREQMMQRNLQFDSLYTVRSLKEVITKFHLKYQIYCLNKQKSLIIYRDLCLI